jgi:sugar/nucleoside kinase (ribokinase family)
VSLIVLGTVALDTVKTPFGQKQQMLGGSAVHFAMAARLFCNVNLVAIVGHDFPKKHIDFLKQKGINLTSLICSKGKTFQWKGEYRGDLNTALTLNTELGVLSTFTPAISDEQRKIKYVFLANIDPDIQRLLLGHMHAPKLVALDSMNYWIRHKRKSLLRLLKNVDIYVANDQEARDLSQENNLFKATKGLRAMGPRMVLIKKGEHGALFHCDKFKFCLPAYPVDKVIDPTGAGDTFAGGFMGYLTQEKKLSASRIKKALAFATVAASFNIEGFGVSKTARLRMKDLENRLSRFKTCISF